MYDTIAEAQYVFSTLESYLKDPQIGDISWPQEIINYKPVFETLDEILSILRSIILESAKLENKYCHLKTPDTTLDRDLKTCCDAISKFQSTHSLANLKDLCLAAGILFNTISSLGGGFINDNDLGPFYISIKSLVRLCTNFQMSCRSITALELTDKLKTINDSLSKFKDKLDDLAKKTEKVAEIATFLAKAVAVIAKVLALL